MSDQNKTVQDVNGTQAAAPEVNDATKSASIDNLVDDPLPLTDVKESNEDAEGDVPLEGKDEKGADDEEEGAGVKRKAEDELAGESKKQATESEAVTTSGAKEDATDEVGKTELANGHAEEDDKDEAKTAVEGLDEVADDESADEPKGKEPEAPAQPTSAESDELETETSQGGGPEDPVVIEDKGADAAEVAPRMPSETKG